MGNASVSKLYSEWYSEWGGGSLNMSLYKYTSEGVMPIYVVDWTIDDRYEQEVDSDQTATVDWAERDAKHIRECIALFDSLKETHAHDLRGEDDG